jgi:O-antigen ligase
MLQWICSRAIRHESAHGFPIDRVMLGLFIVPYVVSHLVAYDKIDEIPVELAYAEGGFANLSSWYLSHLGMSLLTTIGIAATVALALRRGADLTRLLIVAALPLWPIVTHAVLETSTSGLSLTELTSEENRSFLQNSTFAVHGNAFGQYALFGYILFLGAAQGSKKNARTFFLATAALCTAGILVSFSRTAWGAWILVTTLWNVTNRGRNKWVVPAVIACAMLLMPEALFQRIWKGIAERDIDQILSGRLDHMWIPVLEEVWIRPFFGQGWGAYMWSEAFKSGVAFRTSTVHNAYIRLLLESGVVGLLLVGFFYRSLWRQAHELENRESSELPKAMLKSARWLVFAMLITGVTGDAITPEMIQIYFWYGVGILLSVRVAAHARELDVRQMSCSPSTFTVAIRGLARNGA